MVVNFYGLDGSMFLSLPDVSETYSEDVFYCSFSKKQAVLHKVPLHLIAFIEHSYPPEPITNISHIQPQGEILNERMHLPPSDPTRDGPRTGRGDD